MLQNTQKDLTLIFTSIAVISLTVIGLMMFPDQAKVLADSLQSLLKQLPLRLLLTEEADLTGDMVAVATLEEESETEETTTEKGEDVLCQPMRLSAPMEAKCRLKIV